MNLNKKLFYFLNNNYNLLMILKQIKFNGIDILIKKINIIYLYKYQPLFIIFNVLKLLVFIYIVIIIIIYNMRIPINNMELKYNYLDIKKKFNLTFNKELKNKIRIGIYAYTMKNGGRARITAQLLNYFSKINIFQIYLFTVRMKQDNEYIFPNNITRVITKNNLIKLVKIYKIDILIYQLDYINEIANLNNIKDIKVLYYIHSSTLDWIYANYTIFKTIYNEYLKSKYLVSLVPFENDYIFRKWGIKSIFMNNFITYDYNSIISSDLSSKIILMLGRANDKKKRFKIGILSMEYIIPEIPQCELRIISNLTGINKQQNLIYNLNLEKNIKFIGYSCVPEIFFNNASLNLFPSISESFGLVLSETKLYGIPNILLGLDYVSISKGGTKIIYDDTPESLSKNILKILKNSKFRRKLGKEARKSMLKFNNELLLDKWVQLIMSIFIDNENYEEFREKDQKMLEMDAKNILNNQINLLNMRKQFVENITIEIFENYFKISNLTKIY